MMQSVALTESTYTAQQRRGDQPENEEDFVLVDGSGEGRCQLSDDSSYDYCEEFGPLPSPCDVKESNTDEDSDSRVRREEEATHVSELIPELGELDVEDAITSFDFSELESLRISQDLSLPVDVAEEKSPAAGSSSIKQAVVLNIGTGGDMRLPWEKTVLSPNRKNDINISGDELVNIGQAFPTGTSADESVCRTSKIDTGRSHPASSRLSSKKRRKKVKLAKKAAAAAAAAAALSHVRTFTARTPPSSPPHRNKHKIAPLPATSSTRKKKENQAEIARRNLRSYKQEVASGQQCLGMKTR